MSTAKRFALTGVDLVCTRGGGRRGCSFNLPTRRFRDEAAAPLVGGFASAPAELTCWRDGEGERDCEIRMVPRLPG